MWNDFKNFLIALYILLRRIILLFINIFVGIYRFLCPIKDSVKGVVAPEEFYRVLLLAISTGGSFEGFLKYIHGHLQDFVTDPVVIVGVQEFVKHCNSKHLPAVFFIVVFAGDYLRRRNHGTIQ